MRIIQFGIGVLLFSTLISCNKSDDYQDIPTYPNVAAAFGNNIDPNHLDNYANQVVPAYITKDNTQGNTITDKGATLGRVLFYDKKLSSNNTISCASCHIQSRAFSDSLVVSLGVNGTTARHTMRLVNARFGNEKKFFWDKRAPTLEFQTTQPIRNHTEMGYSGLNGDPSINDLITKLSAIGYYQELFQFVYGSPEITEDKIQLALAQFVRSIQSFDSRYDIGRAQTTDDVLSFPNLTSEENKGKRLFMTLPVFDATGKRTTGGIGCVACHNAPEFDIDPNTKNNGILGTIGSNAMDITVVRAPSLRDLTQTNGKLNGPLMHTGIITTLQNVLDHYGLMNVATANTNLDPRLVPNGFGQDLNMSSQEINSVIAFLKTLAGTNVYTDPKWSNPFHP
jgi:cytochrome c peroxidase